MASLTERALRVPGPCGSSVRDQFADIGSSSTIKGSGGCRMVSSVLRGIAKQCKAAATTLAPVCNRGARCLAQLTGK